MRFKPTHIIALVILLACMGAALFSLSGAMAPHVTVAEAKARAGETVQVPGQIVKESVRFSAERGGMEFEIIGIGGTQQKPLLLADQRMLVVYNQGKPDSFDTANQVEAIGTYKDGVFRANRLLVKCPSKYSDEQPKVAAAK
jgi:cytochrome c-type biogenesis protein CcmE